MAVIITLDVMLAKRKMKSKELAAQINVTEANLSKLKSGNVKGIKLATLDKLCAILDCKPADLIDYVPDEE